jgi:hypothetical protein
MRTILLTAGLACSLYADSKIEGPKLGYVSSPGGIRTVLGIVGASRLSAPLTAMSGAVLPGQDVAFGMDSQGRLIRINLLEGSSGEVGVSNVTRVVASVSGDAVAALTETRLVTLAKDGSQIADFSLPAAPQLLAIADTGTTAAVTVREGDEQALYVLSRESSRRVFAASKIPAVGFLPGTSDLVLADEAGAIYRLNADLQLARLGEVTGAGALAITRDRVIVISGHTLRSIPLAGGEATSIDCSCTPSMAQSLGESRFLLTPGDEGPMWVLDASGTDLRVAFIPEAVNE